MSRRLVQGRSRQSDTSSASTPVQRRHREDVPVSVHLPPYEPPSCVLSAKARTELNKLRVAEEEMRKYRKHLDFSQKTIPDAVAQLNDKANKRKQAKERWASKRIAEGRTDDDKTQVEKDEEVTAVMMTKQSKELTERSEKALRDIIDYGDEQSMHGNILQEVIDSIAAIPPPPLDALEDEEEEAASITSTVELLENARSGYLNAYQSKPMYQRYADNNSSYNDFKKLVHDSLYGDTIQLPKATSWFTGNEPNIFYGLDTATNNANDEEGSDDDDEVVIAGSKTEYKCPLTFAVFEHPYTSKVCKHTYEKQAILEFIESGTVFGGRGGPKQVQCPHVGCEKMVTRADLFDDELIRRKVKRFLEEAARDDEDEDEDMEEEDQPTQPSRNMHKQQKSGVKSERRSRGPRVKEPLSSDVED